MLKNVLKFKENAGLCDFQRIKTYQDFMKQVVLRPGETSKRLEQDAYAKFKYDKHSRGILEAAVDAWEVFTMEIRILRYFLTVVREENISKAAEVLHITQPTLSRQLAQLEEELGTQLFCRGSRKITLTSEGMLLRRRAEEIIELMDKTVVVKHFCNTCG
jgi:DNA-binding transcriptional ArsR family regulator